MRIALLAVAAAFVTGGVAIAAPSTPIPHGINVEQLQPRSLLPKRKLHSEFIVEVNKYGQVARVRSGKDSGWPPFNAQTYGNALQAFIRTTDNHVVVGVYRLTYDYNPKTARVHRDVTLVRRGGVNPNAEGAANQMMEIARRNRTRTPPPALAVTPAPHPAPSVNIKRMPDLPQVMKSPGH